MPWTKTEDSNPTESGYYLAAWKNGEHYVVDVVSYHTNIDYGRCRWWDRDAYDVDVEAWMPLPEYKP